MSWIDLKEHEIEEENESQEQEMANIGDEEEKWQRVEVTGW